jgi:hypothetical protein
VVSLAYTIKPFICIIFNHRPIKKTHKLIKNQFNHINLYLFFHQNKQKPPKW